MTVTTVPLGELMATKKQSLDPRKTPERRFALYSIPAYDQGRPAETLGGEIGSSKQVLQPGDVLLSRIVPHIRRAWIVDANGTLPAVGSGEWIIFRGDGFHPPYLRHVLVSDLFHRQFMNTVAGVGGSLLRARPKYVERIEIPLPPLEEQRRIASVLDAADALRAKRREALATLESLTQSIFVDMFNSADQAFESVPIGELVSLGKNSIRTGPFGSQLLHEEFTDEGIAVLGIDNAVSNRFVWGQRRFITPQKYEQLKRFTVQPGDVLVTIMGTTGRVAVVPDDIPTAINTKHLCCITLDRSKCLPQYLWAALRFHPSVRRRLGATHGAVMPGLNMGKIKQAEVPVPPLDLQELFLRRLNAVEDQSSVCAASQDATDQLFASLQQRAFRGGL